MKIHYKKPSLLDEMRRAIATSKEPIDHFELTPEEFNQHFTQFGINHFNEITVCNTCLEAFH
jgi:hypothetical protein